MRFFFYRTLSLNCFNRLILVIFIAWLRFLCNCCWEQIASKTTMTVRAALWNIIPFLVHDKQILNHFSEVWYLLLKHFNAFGLGHHYILSCWGGFSVLDYLAIVFNNILILLFLFIEFQSFLYVCFLHSFPKSKLFLRSHFSRVRLHYVFVINNWCLELTKGALYEYQLLVWVSSLVRWKSNFWIA